MARFASMVIVRWCLLLGLACGGTKRAAQPVHAIDLTDTISTPTAPPRQLAACDRMADVTTQCAVADAKAKLGAQELAELEIDRVAPIQRREMARRCARSQLSLRQVEIYETCAAAGSNCESYFLCMDAAAPKSAP